MRTHPALAIASAGLILLSGCAQNTDDIQEGAPTSTGAASSEDTAGNDGTEDTSDDSAGNDSSGDHGSGDDDSTGEDGAGNATGEETGDDDNTDAESADDSEPAPVPAPLPTNATDYADEFVRAWGRGDTDRVAQLSTENVAIMLRGRATENWARVAENAGAGTVHVTYREEETGEEFVLHVDNAKAGQGQEQAVTDVDLERPG